MHLSFYPIWPWPAVLAVGVALAVLAHKTYPQNAPGRRTLLGLRYIAIILAMLAIARPSLVIERKLKQQSSLVLLADKSRSMSLRDMWNSQSRWQALNELLLESDTEFERLAEKVRLRRFVFDRELAESSTAIHDPDGEQSALGEALQNLIQRSAGERIAGIILHSDGSNTSGVSPLTIARQLRSQKVPIHVIGYGEEIARDQVKDLSARTIVASPTVFAKNKMPIRAEFSVSGFGANRQIPVRLKLNDVLAAQGFIETKGGESRTLVDLTAVPTTPGDVKVTIEADIEDGELLPGNNSISTYVTVLSGGISVLHVEGKYRFWEPKFLRWALDQSPDIELSQLFLLNEVRQPGEIKADFFGPGKFDVIILGDVSSSYFEPAQIAAMRAALDQATGLLMIGGYESFGAGNWHQTPIADYLPIEMRASDGQMSRQLRLTPTDTGLRHFVLRLAGSDESNRREWAALRPLDGGNEWQQPKPGSRLLATSEDGTPLLVEQDNGVTRSLAFASDTTWRWRSNKTGVVNHARFWRQLILWLAHKEDSAENQVRMQLARRRLAIGQKLPIEVEVTQPDGNPIENAEVQAVVQTPDGKSVPVDLFRQGDVYRGNFWQSHEPGDYSIRVAATKGSKSIGGKSMKFLVYDEDTEMRQLAADKGLLRDLAKETQGEYLDANIADYRKFIESLRNREMNLEVKQPVSESLWDRWEMLTLFVVVVGLEWYLRKRRGLP